MYVFDFLNVFVFYCINDWCSKFCRNPDHQSRPSFSAISDYLAQPCDTLLYWGLEDTFRDSVGVCGGPLEVAHQLHLDLQKIYMK